MPGMRRTPPAPPTGPAAPVATDLAATPALAPQVDQAIAKQVAEQEAMAAVNSVDEDNMGWLLPGEVVIDAETILAARNAEAAGINSQITTVALTNTAQGEVDKALAAESDCQAEVDTATADVQEAEQVLRGRKSVNGEQWPNSAALERPPARWPKLATKVILAGGEMMVLYAVILSLGVVRSLDLGLVKLGPQLPAAVLALSAATASTLLALNGGRMIARARATGWQRSTLTAAAGLLGADMLLRCTFAGLRVVEMSASTTIADGAGNTYLIDSLLNTSELTPQQAFALWAVILIAIGVLTAAIGAAEANPWPAMLTARRARLAAALARLADAHNRVIDAQTTLNTITGTDPLIHHAWDHDTEQTLPALGEALKARYRANLAQTKADPDFTSADQARHTPSLRKVS